MLVMSIEAGYALRSRTDACAAGACRVELESDALLVAWRRGWDAQHGSCCWTNGSPSSWSATRSRRLANASAACFVVVCDVPNWTEGCSTRRGGGSMDAGLGCRAHFAARTIALAVASLTWRHDAPRRSDADVDARARADAIAQG